MSLPVVSNDEEDRLKSDDREEYDNIGVNVIAIL